jgi:DNA-binding PucR family transcriptional regulator
MVSWSAIRKKSVPRERAMVSAPDAAHSAAAAQLHMHRNTIRNRLRRLEDLTGRSLANPLDLAELHIALECARTLGLG